MSFLLAQTLRIGITNPQEITGPLSGINKLADLINLMVRFIIPFASLVLLFVLIAGGFDFLFSQGNPEKIKAGQAKITTGITGFVLLIISYIFVRVIAIIFGFKEGIL